MPSLPPAMNQGSIAGTRPRTSLLTAVVLVCAVQYVLVASVGTAESIWTSGSAGAGELVFTAARVRAAERVGLFGYAGAGELVFTAARIGAAEDVRPLAAVFGVLCTAHRVASFRLCKPIGRSGIRERPLAGQP
jgi:hypothetical protein